VAVLFIESSALAKRYINETGSTWLRSLLDPVAGNESFIVGITAVEMIAAITRRERGGSLSPADATIARSTFRTDWTAEYQVVEVTQMLIQQATLLAEAHALRGYDAVQLAAALEVNALCMAAGMPGLTLISADAELNAAATVEALPVEDPNAHP
jgi:predicted nucleic acid-binding protein